MLTVADTLLWIDEESSSFSFSDALILASTDINLFNHRLPGVVSVIWSFVAPRSTNRLNRQLQERCF